MIRSLGSINIKCLLSGHVQQPPGDCAAAVNTAAPKEGGGAMAGLPAGHPAALIIMEEEAIAQAAVRHYPQSSGTRAYILYLP